MRGSREFGRRDGRNNRAARDLALNFLQSIQELVKFHRMNDPSSGTELQPAATCAGSSCTRAFSPRFFRSAIQTSQLR